MKTTACFLLTTALAMTTLHAAEPAALPAADPFVRSTEEAEEKEAWAPALVSICLETFSVDLVEGAKLRRSGLDDAKLYAELAARVDKGEAKQESFAMLRVRSGEKAVTESISEYIYPTDMDNGNVAPVAKGENAAVPPQSTATAPVIPTSFETRNAGFTLELEVMLGEDERTIDIRMVPELVTLAERVKWGQGASEAEMPNFECQRITVGTTILAGQPLLIGTMSRPPVSKVDPEAANRVWLCFVTAEVVRPKNEKE